MKINWKLYLDTSVFGGCYDEAEGWDEDSKRVLNYCQVGRAKLIRTPLLDIELRAAPQKINALLQSIPESNQIRVPITEEITQLAEEYLSAKIMTRKSYEDCIHVAAATISRAHAIVSWNFKHIVRLDKIRAFNTVNLTLGYGMITILSPADVYLENLDED
jgi:predicted nucleic acid-binding protein